MRQLIPLKDIVIELESGSRPAGGIKLNTIGIPSVGAEHLNDQGRFNFNNVKFIPNSFFDSQKRGIIKIHDILIVKDGATTGKTSFVDESFPFKKASLNEHVFRVAVDEKSANPKYVFWYLFSEHGKKQIMNNFRGSTIGGITKEFVNGVQLYLPPIEEQHRIVKILDLAQSLIEKRKQAIAYLDDYIKAVFLDMFGDPVSNPKGWEVKKLIEVCTKIADGTHYSPPLVENGIPYITARHLKPKGLDFFRNPTYISQEEHNKIYSRCTPEKGDVLYIKDGATTGIAAINYYDFEFSMLSSLALLKPNSEFIRNHYLCYWLNNPQVKSNLLQQMAGLAIQRFTLTKINNFLIPIPPLEQQDIFCGIVEKINPIQIQMQTQLKELENNFQAELQRAFRGE